MTEQGWSISLSRSDALDVLGVLLGPFVGPVALHIWGVDGDIEELWAVLFGPISYLVVGMAVSHFRAGRLGKTSQNPDRQRLAKRLHDVKILSLLFLALFEGAACILALVPEAWPVVLVFACCFYAPYAACAIAWLMIMKRLQIAESTDGEASSEGVSSDERSCRPSNFAE